MLKILDDVFTEIYTKLSNAVAKIAYFRAFEERGKT